MNNPNCKICSSSTTKYFNRKKTDVYYKCNNCNYIFIENKKILDFKTQKTYYDNHNNSIENKGYVDMFENFINLAILPFSKNINNCLEFGCGPGPVLATLLERKGFTVDRYDPIYFPKIDNSQKYDIITSTEVFEHLVNPIETLENLYSKLKKYGILVIMTQFHTNNPNDFSNWWYIRDKTHISFYDESTFSKLAEKFNMEILFCDKKKICTLKKR